MLKTHKSKPIYNLARIEVSADKNVNAQQIRITYNKWSWKSQFLPDSNKFSDPRKIKLNFCINGKKIAWELLEMCLFQKTKTTIHLSIKLICNQQNY